MKKIVFMCAFAGLVLASLVSCNKADRVPAIERQTVDASLKVNESYTFTLPASKEDAGYLISTQASNFRVSEIGLDATGENMVYTYTPMIDFVGQDQVVISSPEENEGEHHCTHSSTVSSTSTTQGGNMMHHTNHHNFNHHHHGGEDQLEITINLTVVSSNTDGNTVK